MSEEAKKYLELYDNNIARGCTHEQSLECTKVEIAEWRKDRRIEELEAEVAKLKTDNADLVMEAKWYKMKAYRTFNMLGNPEYEGVGTKGRV